jgi:2-oxoisovalerate dehydrogenase E1 component beta subunit
LFFEHKLLYRRLKETLPAEDYIVPIGKAAVRRSGRDLTVVTFGAMVHVALEAAEALAKEGVETEVVDLRTLAPLDRDAILTSVARTSKVIVLHEASRTGGIGGEIAAIIAEEAFSYLDGPVVRVAALDVPVPYSPSLEKASLPNVEKLMAAAKKLIGY